MNAGFLFLPAEFSESWRETWQLSSNVCDLLCQFYFIYIWLVYAQIHKPMKVTLKVWEMKQKQTQRCISQNAFAWKYR